jgi:transposase-like protein
LPLHLCRRAQSDRQRQFRRARAQTRLPPELRRQLLDAIYAAIGVDLEGQKDILGMWFGDGGGEESAKFWMVVLTELRNRGMADVFFLVCDGLKGLPDSVNAVWPATIVQTCLVHLIRNSSGSPQGSPGRS